MPVRLLVHMDSILTHPVPSNLRNKGKGFWSHVEKTVIAKPLWFALDKMYGPYVLTKPGPKGREAEGRLFWLLTKMGITEERVILTAASNSQANDNTILLTGSPVGAEKFRRAGGRSILVPTPSNKIGGEPIKVCLDEIRTQSPLGCGAA
jgi:hypothetical protein